MTKRKLEYNHQGSLMRTMTANLRKVIISCLVIFSVFAIAVTSHFVNVSDHAVSGQPPRLVAPEQMVFANGNVWVSNSGDSTILRFNGQDGRFIHKINSRDFRLKTPMELLKAEHAIYIQNLGSTSLGVMNLDDKSGQIVFLPHAAISEGRGGYAFCANKIWHADNDSLYSLNKFSGSVVRRYGFSELQINAPNVLASKDGYLWVGSNFENTISELDCRTGIVLRTLSIELGNSNQGMTWDGTKLWISSFNLVRVDTTTGLPDKTIDIGSTSSCGDIAVNGDHIWVTTTDGYNLIVVDKSSGTVVKRYSYLDNQFQKNGPLRFTPLHVISAGTKVWASSPQGDSIAIFDSSSLKLLKFIAPQRTSKHQEF